MSQYRLCPFSGTRTIIAGERGGRPHEFQRPVSRRVLRECPFCVGHEHATPPPVAVYGRVAPSLMGEQTISMAELRQASRSRASDESRSMLRWQVRVVPNLFPAVGQRPAAEGGRAWPIERTGFAGLADGRALADLSASRDLPATPDVHPALEPSANGRKGNDDSSSSESAWRQAASGQGLHEVIVESPIHIRSVTELALDQAHLPLVAWRDRLRVMADNSTLQYAQIFRNAGPEAGASIEHLHSQLIAVPFVPPRVATEDHRVTAFHDQNDHCLMCRILGDEVADGSRVILATSRFVVFAPHASRCPFETWIVPRQHAASLAEADESLLRELAEICRKVVGRMEDHLVRPSYNMVLVGSPLRPERPEAWHWRIELFPRLTYQAGFEWGTGCFINPIPPEEAASQLRQWAPEPAGTSRMAYSGFAGNLVHGEG